jgi:isopropylmalate/homocitrate/citramalate synthase
MGLNLAGLTDLARLVRDRAGVYVPSNKPVVGETLYNVESGIITSWVRNAGHQDITEVFPFRWEMVGQNAVQPVLGKGSGLDSVKYFLDAFGISGASEDQVMAILAKVKAASLAEKRLLSDLEFKAIVRSVLDPVAA